MHKQTKKPKNVCAQYMCKHVHIYTHKCMYVQCVLLVMVSKNNILKIKIFKLLLIESAISSTGWSIHQYSEHKSLE